MKKLAFPFALLAGTALAVPASLVAQNAPANLLPGEQEPREDAPEADDAVSSSMSGPVEMVREPVVQQFDPVVQQWTVGQAEALAAVIEGIGAEGLFPVDYDLPGLRAAIAGGAGAMLDEEASQRFVWLVEDMRDGRTPMDARKQWFVMDPDADRYRSGTILKQALADGDIMGALQSVAPLHPDYEALRNELAKAQPGSKRYKLIQANMDRWRWLPRDLGKQYLITNVPEYQLRLTVNDKIMRTYRTIVGKPGRTATPQLAEQVEGVILNPNWTVPQSIVQGEGLGARVLANPGWAKSKGYTATRGANGWISVVQGPGEGNALGRMKLDMPNRHAIFFHDTPSRNLFGQANRALSHGCIRTERATELAFTLAILQAGITADEATEILASGEYTRVGFNSKMPAYITYFTMATNIDGKMTTFNDIYERDGAVLASFEAPRKANRSRVTDEEIIEIVNDPRDIA
ncbi:L,D-transpeptidase family protein [Alteriqipengyuania lutimaris]|uniref:L,D-transpeptidase n=1 Tax=Alteriqipengyuania lutimaris TaxID=1538146 RepID=A0A395LI71_9SPHN|nr:L,D-transpeptidase family protein [Alteriqipengyuania lutimaris]MBB3034800.1 murein L,D-transpeptidase YcbB/YkuD [Alteriqipengyuania lutimaris]RDS76355.1 L,D-transpeptidase [Alteriqipengyuania lutimaris]